MFILMIVVFVLGYAAIVLEHSLKVDKAASALLLGVTTWVIFVFGSSEILLSNEDYLEYLQFKPDGDVIDYIVHHELLHHLGEISEILFFLLGAMTIVELIDAHEGFRIITDKITTTKRVKLLWILSILTFFFSAALDNLTTSIVMVALLRKLIKDKPDRWFFAGMVILAANAGGAWSPIGDVTTIMLWVGGQVSTVNIIVNLIIPSLVCMIFPLIYLSFTMKGNVERPLGMLELEHLKEPTTLFERKLIFFLGVGGLLFVPVFKTVTHLPPYMGMLFSLGVLWVVTELMHKSKNEEEKSHVTVIGVLKKVHIPTILFFFRYFNCSSQFAVSRTFGAFSQLFR